MLLIDAKINQELLLVSKEKKMKHNSKRFLSRRRNKWKAIKGYNYTSIYLPI